MKLISERLQILNAPENWKRRHLLPDGKWRGLAKKDAYLELMDADLNTISADSVNRMMGFQYIEPIPPCSFCGKVKAEVLESGHAENVYICADCVHQAADAIANAEYPVHVRVPLPINPILVPYWDGGAVVMRFRGVVDMEHEHDPDLEEDWGYHPRPYIGPYDVIGSLDYAQREGTFQGPLTLAIADERFDGELHAYVGSPGYSEYTPADYYELRSGPHNLITVLERYAGQEITMWVADGPFNVLDDEEE